MLPTKLSTGLLLALALSLPSAFAQDSNDLTQRQHQVELKAKMVDILVNSSALQKSGSNAIDAGKAALTEARAALKAGRVDEASKILEQALRALVKASGAANKDASLSESAQKKQFADFEEQVITYRKTIRELESDSRMSTAAKALGNRIDTESGEASRLAKLGKHVEASKKMGDTYRLAVEELSRLRAGQEVVMSLKFDTPADEYAYEQRRYQSSEILVANLLGEGRAEGDKRRLVDDFVSQGRQLRDDAEALATKKQHQAAVTTIEKAVTQLNRALQAMGLPIY